MQDEEEEEVAASARPQHENCSVKKNSFYFRERKLVNIILNREKQIKATSLRPPKSQIKQQQCVGSDPDAMGYT